MPLSPPVVAFDADFRASRTRHGHVTIMRFGCDYAEMILRFRRPRAHFGRMGAEFRLSTFFSRR